MAQILKLKTGLLLGELQPSESDTKPQVYGIFSDLTTWGHPAKPEMFSANLKNQGPSPQSHFYLKSKT